MQICTVGLFVIAQYPFAFTISDVLSRQIIYRRPDGLMLRKKSMSMGLS
jgi:hypothetical protein